MKKKVKVSCRKIKTINSFPNLIVGAITKESIYGAFENGIAAEQVTPNYAAYFRSVLLFF
jgi:hypothetical protein